MIINILGFSNTGRTTQALNLLSENEKKVIFTKDNDIISKLTSTYDGLKVGKECLNNCSIIHEKDEEVAFHKIVDILRKCDFDIFLIDTMNGIVSNPFRIITIKQLIEDKSIQYPTKTFIIIENKMKMVI